MTEEREHIPMDISPGTVSAPFQVELQHIKWRVALALNGIEKATEEDLSLPGTPIDFSPAANVPKSLENSKVEFRRWVIANGLRDCAEAVHAHLEITYARCLLMQLGAQTGKIPSEILEEKYERPKVAFHDFNIDKKLKTLTTEFAVTFREDTWRCFKSLNKVRNCLSHRGGVVRKIDCNREEQFEIEWRVLVPIREDGSEVEFGKPLNSPSLSMRNDTRKRVFNIGQQIDFSSRDFAEFLMNYNFLALETIDKVNQYAADIGILDKLKSQTG